MTKPQYRLARAADYPELITLINGAYRGESARAGWTTEADLIDGQRIDDKMLSEMMGAPGAVILLAEEEGQIEACVYLRRAEHAAYLGMLTVRPTKQSSGIGKQLLAAAEEWVTEVWGVNTIEMRVINKRAELIAWYERRGYRVTPRSEPFPYGDERYGIPRARDLSFTILEKRF